MDNVLVLDTSVGSLNKGDDIIMKCVRYQLSDITKSAYILTLPTHVSPFHWYQVARGSHRVKLYSNAKYKFVGGSNLLTMDMLTHFPQWNINMFNYGPLKGSILVGVGAGKGNKINAYTKMLYKKVLSHEYIHSVRDERTKKFLEEMGLKALNTGCATMWSLTPEFCKEIPTEKSDSVIFTLTHHLKDLVKDQLLIDVLRRNYKDVYFWIQDASDFLYFESLSNTEDIKVVPPNIEAYEKVLNTDIDYIGTRLHGGIFAMRHKKRTIIISIDERARGMSETYNLNLIERADFDNLEKMINSKIITDVKVNFEVVDQWLKQFSN
ncbi:polysaccharide pyruvyl transferase family protein [Bacillus mobilis]|uniref:Polysaccharide pyruvyl transferase n=1 Tax=Bacillus mobilis TaxID=2026190 RepID=A0A1Y6AAA8_9BACI|nr:MULTISPECIES: polysaccharide pyruvyl transferase family protein [Bacillus]AYF07701.1 polysaccharide pyruvyl transferase family protein [Bacillus mobilis]MCU5707168.1 polysaccharide pyruvyl transferase family protein [Bacillus wiedmannii]MED0936406.1 polysaccharide pyruvyl transferase family protein [Bacillus mobilis]PEJ69065.1 polysaccharide pyruvyl transferase family protein [Bacillus wiedmannii]PER28662.1 polysaccharide pyruvyl transferase family protein [Bacillus cereus]